MSRSRKKRTSCSRYSRDHHDLIVSVAFFISSIPVLERGDI
nr:MAG TPA: hypothetical protein [Caudoviricetes sp.]